MDIPLVTSHTPLTCHARLKRCGNALIHMISPKQAVRPDHFFQTVREALPSVKHLAVSSVAKLVCRVSIALGLGVEHPLQRHVAALELLSTFADEKRTTPLKDSERGKLTIFLNLLAVRPDLFQNLQTYVICSGKAQAFCQKYKFLALPYFENTVEKLQLKVRVIQATIDSPHSAPLPEDLKLQPRDYGFLCAAERYVKLLDALCDAEVMFQDRYDLLQKWSQIAEINRGPTIQRLRSLCLDRCVEGRIFIGDRVVRNAMSDTQPDMKAILKNVFGGTLGHIGVYVKDANGRLCLSHVNSEPGTHIVKPVLDPLYFAFHHQLDLNMRPLLFNKPPHLMNAFSQAFIQHAKQEYPQVKLADDRNRLYFLLFGHKGISRRRLSEVTLSAQQPEMRSSYIAKVFLQAIHTVNIQMAREGHAPIPHPFGEYEIPERIDILRLVDHLKRLYICRMVQPNPVIAKVIRLAKWNIDLSVPRVGGKYASQKSPHLIRQDAQHNIFAPKPADRR